jgi:hypothetical protein
VPIQRKPLQELLTLAVAAVVMVKAVLGMAKLAVQVLSLFVMQILIQLQHQQQVLHQLLHRADTVFINGLVAEV